MKVTLTIEGKQYQVSIQDLNTRPIIAEVDGKFYEVWQEEDAAPNVGTSAVAASTPVPVVAAAPIPAPAAGALSLTAPLPGVIFSIEVREGEMVKPGQELYVLEAMKMKNSVKSDREGRIATIHVSAGEQVKHNQPVMTFEG